MITRLKWYSHERNQTHLLAKHSDVVVVLTVIGSGVAELNRRD